LLACGRARAIGGDEMEFFGGTALAVADGVAGVSGAALHTRVVVLAAFFVVFTLGLSSFLVFQHLSTYTDPDVSSNSLFPLSTFLRAGLDYIR
jgi:preprotein translocase subunit SecG